MKRILPVTTVLIAILCAASCGQIGPKDEVVFYPTYGWLDPDGQHWNVPIHGRIFHPRNETETKPALWAARHALGIDEDEAKAGHFDERGKLFLADGVEGRSISIRLGNSVLPVGKSAENGHFCGTLRFTPMELSNMFQVKMNLWGGRYPFSLAVSVKTKEIIRGEIVLIPPGVGVSVISDIDDTVKVTDVRNKKELIRNSLVRDYQAVAGMPELYKHWEEAGASFHYVTASPWQLYRPLKEFFAAKEIPMGSFDMKEVNGLDLSFFNLFESPDTYKRETIGPILATLPKEKFILVGDSGEKDPEAYGRLAREHPDQIQRIFIRNVTDEPADGPRFAKAFEGVPKEKWRVFTDPKELMEEVKEVAK